MLTRRRFIRNVSLGGQNPMAKQLANVPPEKDGISIGASQQGGALTFTLDLPATQAKSLAMLGAMIHHHQSMYRFCRKHYRGGALQLIRPVVSVGIALRAVAAVSTVFLKNVWSPLRSRSRPST